MSALPWNNPDRAEALFEQLNKRVLLLDGAMGTMIQQRKLTEEDYRGDRLTDHGSDMKGNNDMLSLTQPDIIREIHNDFLEVGSDLVETNTFNSNRISQADYDAEDYVPELNETGARIAREACDAFEKKNPDKPRFVVGVLGPTNRTASISPDVSNPGYRAVTFDDLVENYEEAAHSLFDGGADMLMIETVFDTLNAKAAGFAVNKVFQERKARWPLIISGTITDASGRTLSGQTPEAFYYSINHTGAQAVGFNCALGARQLKPHVEALSKVAECYVTAHPNAGLPNEMGEYDETPEQMADQIRPFLEDRLVNIIGGCCGTTPDHLSDIHELVSGAKPRQVKA